MAAKRGRLAHRSTLLRQEEHHCFAKRDEIKLRRFQRHALCSTTDDAFDIEQRWLVALPPVRRLGLWHKNDHPASSLDN
jgi:hypothetical protein